MQWHLWVVLDFLDPKPFDQWSHTGYVCKSMYNRILIDNFTNRTSSNVQTKIKLKP